MTPPLSEKVKRNWGSSWEEWKSSNFTLKKNKIVAYSAFTSWVLDGETMETMTDYFLGLQNLHPWNKNTFAHWKKSYDQPRQHITKQRHYFDNKALSNQNWFFYYEWMWELDHKESWALKKWCFWTVVLEKTLESSLDCKEIQSVHPKGDQSWVLIGGTDAKAETPILWPPDMKSWFNAKDPDTEKDWRWEEKGMTDEMVGWHHQLDGHEFE